MEESAEIIDKICDYSTRVNLKGLLHEYLKRFLVFRFRANITNIELL